MAMTQPAEFDREAHTSPVPISQDELEPLGSVNGKQWFKHRRHGELRVRGIAADAAGFLPNLPVVELEGRRWLILEPQPSGSFARLSAPAVPKRRPANRLVDGFVAAALAPRSERAIAPKAAPPSPFLGALGGKGYEVDSPALYIRPAKPPVRGAPAILALLAKKGVSVALSLDEATLVVRAERGRLGDLRQVILEAQPLLVAHLRGAPLRCQVAAHADGENDEAVTVALGGTPACDRHLGERTRP